MQVVESYLKQEKSFALFKIKVRKKVKIIEFMFVVFGLIRAGD